MDILFINPPWYKKSGNIWKEVSACMPPFGLALLASLVREKGHSVSMLDCNALQLGLDDIERRLPGQAPEFVGLTASTVLIENALETAKLAKKKYPNAKVIIGGVHATVLPEEVLSSEWVDYVAMGEGEGSLLELLSNKNPQDIKGIGFKKNGQIVINQQPETIPDINIFPFMSYDLLPMDKYYPAAGSYKRKPSFGMITSRGCPGRCTFCKGSLLGERIRFRSAEKVFEEIKFLQDNYGIKDITFYDDTFTASRTRMKEFCGLIIKNNFDLSWCCFSRVDTVDFEMLVDMKKAGCYQILYGVESADPEILKNMNKKITFEKVEVIAEATKKLGIETRLSFMLGSPGETEETIKKTISYAIKLDPDLVSFNITTPYPGTEMFCWAKKNNLLLHENWNEYNFAKPVLNLPTISTDKVLYYYKKAHRQFYMRPAYIWKRIKKIRSIDDFIKDVGPFLRLIKFNFSKQ